MSAIVSPGSQMLEDDLCFLQSLRDAIDRYLFLGHVPHGTTPGGRDPDWEKVAAALQKPEFYELRRRINEGKPRAKAIMENLKISAVFSQYAPPLVGGSLLARQHILDIVTDNRTWERVEKAKVLDLIDQAIGGVKDQIRKRREDQPVREETMAPYAPVKSPSSGIVRKGLRKPWYSAGWVKGIAALATIAGFVWQVFLRPDSKAAISAVVSNTTQNQGGRVGAIYAGDGSTIIVDGAKAADKVDPQLIDVFFSEWNLHFKSGEMVRPPQPIKQGEQVDIRLAVQDDNLHGARIRDIFLSFPKDADVKSGEWAGRVWVRSNALDAMRYFYQFDNNVPKGEMQFLAPISVSFRSSGVKQIGVYITADGLEAIHRSFLFEVSS